jgi:hypothetical protein
LTSFSYKNCTDHGLPLRRIDYTARSKATDAHALELVEEAAAVGVGTAFRHGREVMPRCVQFQPHWAEIQIVVAFRHQGIWPFSVALSPPKPVAKSCGRTGSYRRGGLVKRFGGGIALPDVLLELASCERRADFLAPCGARLTDLAVSAG